MVYRYSTVIAPYPVIASVARQSGAVPCVLRWALFGTAILWELYTCVSKTRWRPRADRGDGAMRHGQAIALPRLDSVEVREAHRIPVGLSGESDYPNTLTNPRNTSRYSYPYRHSYSPMDPFDSHNYLLHSVAKGVVRPPCLTPKRPEGIVLPGYMPWESSPWREVPVAEIPSATTLGISTRATVTRAKGTACS